MSLFDEIINAAVEITGHVTKYAVVSQLVGQERGQALEQISNLVNGVTSEQLDWLEQQFLIYAQAQHSPDLRIRAMELYAWLKICELARYGEFRGFATHGGRLNGA